MLRKPCLSLLFSMLLTVCIGSIGCAQQNTTENLESVIKSEAILLKKSADLDSLIKKAADKRLVLLGEATHGTKEFYEWRAEISKRLIEEAGFNFIVVEGDWQPFCQVNRFVKGYSDYKGKAESLMRKHFSRWPPWMWGNPVMAELVDWLRKHNMETSTAKPAGIYGMDVYGQWESMQALKDYISKSGSKKLLKAKANYECFADYNYDEWAYARAVMSGRQSCEPQVKEVVRILRENKKLLVRDSEYDYFSAKQNALVMQNAELYYRSAVMRGPDGWNNRVLHMKQTVKRLLDFYGKDSKAIVWAHNTHVGDARATSMKLHGQINIGHLAREHYGDDNVYIVGFGTHRGKVKAGERWGSPGRIMTVPAGRAGSIEDIFNRVSYDSFLIHVGETKIAELQKSLLHRAIGVVYNPQREAGNYVPSILSRRYDSFIFIDETTALKSL